MVKYSVHNFTYVTIIFLLLTNVFCFSQTQWSYAASNLKNAIGVPNTGLKAGQSKFAGEPKITDPSVEQKYPVEVNLKFKALKDVSQIIIVENFNPGCVTKIEIGNISLNLRETVYAGDVETIEEDFRINNFIFESKNYNVTDVWLTCSPDKVPGVNQIDAVAISTLKEKYQPQINMLQFPFFDGEVNEVNLVYEKKIHSYSASTPLVNQSETKLYFSSNVGNMFHNEELFEVDYKNDSLKKYKQSEYNFPIEISTATGIIAAFDDEVILSNMSFPKPTYYHAFKSEKNKINYKPFYIEDYKNDRGAHQYEIISRDKKVMIISQTRDGNNDIKYKQDLYVCFLKDNGNYSAPLHMGDVLNTTGNEVPSYLNSNNDTLFFSSDGHLGFGGRDIFYSVKQDSSYTNWSEPKNLGSTLNTEDKEIYFTISPQKKKAYFTRNGRIMELQIADPYRKIYTIENASLEVKNDTMAIKNSEIVILRGTVLNKTNGLPLYAEISVFDLQTNERVFFSQSDSISGEYQAVLQSGKNYYINASAENFITISENVNLTEVDETIEVEKDLFLVPFIVGQSIRLNNIFFETAKWDLLPESNFELDKLYLFLKINTTITIEIAGHTDSQGDDTSNQILSENRAKSVMNYLLDKGIESSRISSVGYGETTPEATNDNEEGRTRNRRVEFKIISQ